MREEIPNFSPGTQTALSKAPATPLAPRVKIRTFLLPARWMICPRVSYDPHPLTKNLFLLRCCFNCFHKGSFTTEFINIYSSPNEHSLRQSVWWTHSKVMKQMSFVTFEGEEKESLVAISPKQIFNLNSTAWWWDIWVSCPEGQSMIPQPSAPANHYQRVSLDQPWLRPITPPFMEPTHPTENITPAWMFVTPGAVEKTVP